MDQLLEELGLTKHEITIYKSLLDNGPSLAGEITQKTGIHRRNVYDCLERLIKKGLAGYIQENNRRVYSLADPELLLQSMKQREAELESLMPQLRAKYSAFAEKKETLFFRGIRGVQQVFEDQIKVGKEVLVQASSVKVSHIIKHFIPRYEMLRKKYKVRTRMLFDTSRNTPEGFRGLEQVPMCDFRFLHNFNTSPMSQYIYGDNVAIIVWSEQPLAILIRQKEVAQGFRDAFEVLWKIAAPKEKRA